MIKKTVLIGGAFVERSKAYVEELYSEAQESK